MKLINPLKKWRGILLPLQMGKTLGLVVLLFYSNFLSSQHLPNDYMLKVAYQKVKQVRYQMLDTSQLKCLTFKEIAEYHDYSQLTNEIEIIDMDGELLSETIYQAEDKVRDDWMGTYHKVAVAKDSIYVYDADKRLLVTTGSSIERELFTEEEVTHYKNYTYDENYFNGMLLYLMQEGIPHNISNNIVSFQSDAFELHTFDNNTKTGGVTYFDSSGKKIQEEIFEFTLLHHNVYKPKSQCTVEWITTKNGCCLKKITEIFYLNFTRQTNILVHPEADFDDSESDINTDLGDLIEISSINESNMVLISLPESLTNDVYRVSVYDLNGKQVSEQMITQSTRITVPQGCANGMYIIHVHNAKNNTFKVGKTINPYQTN